MNTSYVPVAATFSKDASFYGSKFPVTYIYEGQGARVKGSDGKWYLDWVSGLGACLLGYGEGTYKTGFSAYVKMHVDKGNGFSLPSELEYVVAEQLAHVVGARIPGWTAEDLQVRWVKTGSDACGAATRLARAATGRTTVVSNGYHGDYEEFVALTPPAHGCNKHLRDSIVSLEFNANIDAALEKRGYAAHNVAAVIVEQGIAEPDPTWYADLRKWCNTKGALLILDEVVTGLRYAVGGACELYKIQPDLICLGKSLGNGLPIAALVGPREYMSWFARNDPVFVSSTNFGDTTSLAAARYVLTNWDDDSVDHLWDIGERLLWGLRHAGYTVLGNAPRSLLQFTDAYEKAYFIWQMAERGIIMNRPNFPKLCNTAADVDLTIEAATEVFKDLQKLGQKGLREILTPDDLPKVLFTNR
jgi:glutamate-1-semialdehyde 2,1-aminomutase